MLKDPRNFLWLLPLAILLTIPLWKPIAADFLSPERKNTDAAGPALTNVRVLSSSAMAGVQFEQSKDGTREWLITASRLYSSENDPYMQLEDVQALFFGPAREKEEARIRSQKARYNSKTRQIILQGNVVIRSDKGYEMRTQSLEYLPGAKKIKTTTAADIRGNNIEVSGNRLLYDIVSGNYSLSGNVVCKVW